MLASIWEGGRMAGAMACDGATANLMRLAGHVAGLPHGVNAGAGDGADDVGLASLILTARCVAHINGMFSMMPRIFGADRPFWLL